MEKLGLGYEAFKQVNSRIIYAGASAFGTKGRLGWKPGNDILAQAMSGLMSTTGEEGDGPVPTGVAVADHIGAVTMALGILAALLARERTGGRGGLTRLLDEHFSTRPTAEWLERLEAADLFCAPVYDYAQVATEPQAYDNGYLVPVQHPRLGEITVVNCPLEFSETPAAAAPASPDLREHTPG